MAMKFNNKANKFEAGGANDRHIQTAMPMLQSAMIEVGASATKSGDARAAKAKQLITQAIDLLLTVQRG